MSDLENNVVMTGTSTPWLFNEHSTMRSADSGEAAATVLGHAARRRTFCLSACVAAVAERETISSRVDQA